MRVQEIWVGVLSKEVRCELGDVEDFDVVGGAANSGAPIPAPAIVVGGLIVDLVLLLFGSGKLEEVLGECKLAVYLFLSETVVFDIEL